jgi:hypothetical protein
MYPLCIFFVSTSFVISANSGDREETKRRQVSALSPLRNASKKSFEVLRLGLAWVQSENFHKGPRGYSARCRNWRTPLRIWRKPAEETISNYRLSQELAPRCGHPMRQPPMGATNERVWNAGVAALDATFDERKVYV